MRRSISLIGLVLMAAGCGTSTTASPSGATMPNASFASPASPVGSPVDLTWTEVDRPDADSAWSAQGLFADSDGFSVFGSVGEHLFTWDSSDGNTWTSAPLVGFDSSPERAAATTDATVLVGGGSTNRCAHPFGWFLWRRVHGEPDWAGVPFQEDLFCAGGQARIAASADAFVVAGTGTGEQPFAWRSVDGMRWFDVSKGLSFDAPPALLASTADGFLEVGRGSITDVRLLGSGGWRAVAGPPVPPAFNPVGAGLEPSVLLATHAGPMVFFQSEDGDKATGWLRQPDGTWSQVSLAGIPGGFMQGGSVIRGVPYLFVFDGTWSHLYTTRDLATWSLVPSPQLSEIGGLAVFGDRVLLLGNKDPVAMGIGNPGLFVADLPAP